MSASEAFETPPAPPWPAPEKPPSALIPHVSRGRCRAECAQQSDGGEPGEYLQHFAEVSTEASETSKMTYC
jgi:hypothetical protein